MNTEEERAALAKAAAVAKGELYLWAEEQVGIRPNDRTKKHRVTIRMTDDALARLDCLARVMGLSRTGCAEEMFDRVVYDLCNHLNLLDDADAAPETSGDAAAAARAA